MHSQIRKRKPMVVICLGGQWTTRKRRKRKRKGKRKGRKETRGCLETREGEYGVKRPGSNTALVHSKEKKKKGRERKK